MSNKLRKENEVNERYEFDDILKVVDDDRFKNDESRKLYFKRLREKKTNFDELFEILDK